MSAILPRGEGMGGKRLGGGERLVLQGFSIGRQNVNCTTQQQTKVAWVKGHAAAKEHKTLNEPPSLAGNGITSCRLSNNTPDAKKAVCRAGKVGALRH